jgi:hypothetical protein
VSRATACVLSWKFCNNVEWRLNWVYIGADEIHFSSKIESNHFFAIEIEEEHRLNSLEI